MTNSIVSKSFDRLAEEFKQHDKQAAQTFIAMLNTQEAAKLEYQNSTGKVHGFNDAWAEVTGLSKKTVEEYNRLAKKTVELRKKSEEAGFSGFSMGILREYASVPTEVREVVQELIADGEKVTPRDIRNMRESLTASRAKELATLINENEAQIKSLGQSMIDRAIASGRHLIEIKEMLPHGEFMPFCRDNVAVKKSQLAKYMKAASEEGRLPEYLALEGGLEKGLAGFINFLSPEKPEVCTKEKSLFELIDMEKSFDLAPATKTRSVYVITNPGFPGWVKIGMSNDVPKRLAGFQTASPYEYQSHLVAELPNGMRDLSIHDFAGASASDKSGEWFQMPSDKAVALVGSLIDLANREAA